MSGIRTLLTVALGFCCAAPVNAQAPERRPMDFPDLFRQAAIGEVSISPAGDWLLYTISYGSFPERSTDTQIRLTALDGTADRAMTHSPDGEHRDARWHPSGELFGFTSSRGQNGRQLYLMAPDGGEARQVTAVPGGIAAWGWSHDGESLAFLAGSGENRQIWITDGHGEAEPRRLTDHRTPISDFRWRQNEAEILFLAPDSWDAADHRRRQLGFQARPIQRGYVFPDFLSISPAHVWSIAASAGPARRVTNGDRIVHSFEESPRGDLLALVVGPVDSHADTRPREIYLADIGTGELRRLTQNHVSESIVGFSPDGSKLAITAPRDFAGSGVNDIFVLAVDGGDWIAVTGDFDSEVSNATWGADGGSIFFVGNQGVTRQFFVADAAGGGLRRLSDVEGVVAIRAGDEGATAVIGFSDARSPTDLFAVPWAELGQPASWTRLTHANPWVDSIALAETRIVRWTSSDGTQVEGLLIYPLNHDPGRRYPLITEIHGGPASAFELGFLPSAAGPHRAYGHLLAGMDYALFLPNYRGSSNYGHEFRTQISGDYWTRATEDIHTGIDYVIGLGLAHPDSLGFMGWSAGGHWSNWMLVTTDRFKAIATGAGVTNWISLYGQTDNQASREFYLGRNPALDARNKPWDDFEHWWAESPLKYINNAVTPTLIHFPEKDQRIPMPQGQELHMALKGLGVPTEFLVYPGELHALREPRNQLVKLLGDLGWFEKHIRGAETWLDWSHVLDVAARIEAALKQQPGR